MMNHLHFHSRRTQADQNHIDTQGKCVHLEKEWKGPPCRLYVVNINHRRGASQLHTRRSKLQNHALPKKSEKSPLGFSLSGGAAAPRPEYYYTKQ
jgi:hypothetical protein